MSTAPPAAPLARRNPVAKLAAGLLFTLPLLVTLDPVTPAVALAVELALLPAFGLRPAALARHAWPLLLAVLGVVVTVLLFSTRRDGAVVLAAGPLELHTGTLADALGLGLRVVALALPGVLVFATTDPTDLADALVQNARAPERFALGALAAVRLLPLLVQEWQMLTTARRARGIDAGRNPAARVRLFASTVFALLVAALRRAGRLAVAMDARGFDSGTPRTHARRQVFGRADVALVVGAGVLAGAALAAGVLSGTFRPVIG